MLLSSKYSKFVIFKLTIQKKIFWKGAAISQVANTQKHWEWEFHYRLQALFPTQHMVKEGSMKGFYCAGCSKIT